MDIKIRIKAGMVEIEYEGDAEFLKDDLSSVINEIVDCQKRGDLTMLANTVSAAGESAAASPAAAVHDMSVGTIASKLRVNSGPELLIAAAAHLTLVMKKDSFTRAELSREMRDAKSFFKKSYTSNLSKMISAQIKAGTILEGTGGSFSLSAGKLDELVAHLGN
ncbi:hypothetical protein [Raoultibacter timonensis]|uniref:hypothetical protein n=1 Tax=Raoultibacter timonensis TaxID=1907662 RepID=UPI0026DBC7C5|nr:hypothetical protein [Raoultibacter timonensis]